MYKGSDKMNYLNIHNEQDAYMRAAMLKMDGYQAYVLKQYMYYQIRYWR